MQWDRACCTIPKCRNIGTGKKCLSQHGRKPAGQTWSPKVLRQGSGVHDGIICHLKRLGYPTHTIPSLPPAAHVDPPLHVVLSLHVASLSGHVQHMGVSLQLKLHLHIFTQWPPWGISDPDTLCLASTAIWSPCQPPTPTPFSTAGASLSFLVWACTLTQTAHSLSSIPWHLLYQILGCCTDSVWFSYSVYSVFLPKLYLGNFYWVFSMCCTLL